VAGPLVREDDLRAIGRRAAAVSSSNARVRRRTRDEGLLEFRRGRGITVSGSPERSAVIERTKDLLDYARHQGYQPNELVRIIQDLS
jgi:DNA-binding transcriptional regulator YhcF (GntR family)